MNESCILRVKGLGLIPEGAMAFGLYALGAVILIIGLVYVAVLAHVASHWIVAMVIIVAGAGIIGAVNNTKMRDPR